MKVWVIMGNDFPDAVKISEEAARKYINQKKKEEESRLNELGRSGPKVYWRSYEFEVQS